MSRHQSSRRRTYGRRQHEVKERRRQHGWLVDPADPLTGNEHPGTGGIRPVGGLFDLRGNRAAWEGNG